MLLREIKGVFLLGLLVLSIGKGFGQDYPNKPIRILTGGAGGGADFTSRLVAQEISGPLGQPVVVENRLPLISTEAVAKAAPDGYTLLVSGANIWIVPLLQKVNYDVVRDLLPVSFIEKTVAVLAVNPSVPCKTVQELIALAKAKPGELNYASTVPGSTPQLSAELFKSMAGVNIVGIAYNGSGPALTALISGEAHLIFTDVGLVAPHVKSGRLRALAVTSADPSALMPGLPTLSSSGLPGYESVGMTVMFAPAKTSEAIANRLSQEIARAVHLPDIRQRFLNAGVEIVGSSPAQLAALVNSEVVKIGKVIKDAGIKIE